MNCVLVNYIAIILVCFALGFAPLSGQDETDVLANSPELAFDGSQTEPLILFDRTGGFRPQPPAGFKATPHLMIFADGTVRTGADRPDVQSRQAKLSRKELFELLDFIVNQKQFYDIDTAEIKTAMKNAGKRIMIADALTSQFVVHLKRGSHVVQAYALQFNVEQYPDVPALRRLLAIQQRLNAEYALAQIGDKKLVAEVLRLMNQELKVKRPDMQPFQPKEITYAKRASDGQLTVNAMCEVVDPKTKEWKTRVNATYRKKDADSEATVGLYIVDAK